MKKRKIAYISGTRADFGLMTPVLRAIEQSDHLELKLFTTGMHLMEEFGNTVETVEKLFPQAERINVSFENDQKWAAAKFTGTFQSLLVEILKDQVDFVLVLGDRPEMLSTSLVCLYLGIPIGHIHGGEKTSTVDEVARHAITKLSSIHFAATEESAQRIQEMGEESWRIQVVGAPALDFILNEQLPSKEKLFKKLSLDPNSKIILVTQHPVSWEINQAAHQMAETIEAVKSFNLQVVVIYPNADAGGREMIKVINQEKNKPLFRIFPSLDYRDFLALQRESAVWVGNSSGALIESASFQLPAVNVGTRQLGRQRSDNVIDVSYNKSEIVKAIEKSLNDEEYLKKLKGLKNIWGDGQAAKRIISVLEELEIGPKLLIKQITY